MQKYQIRYKALSKTRYSTLFFHNYVFKCLPPSTQTLADLILLASSFPVLSPSLHPPASQIMSNHILQRHLQTSFTYSLFETVTSTLLQGVTGVEGDGPVARTGCPAPEKEERVQREQIALACEVTSKLSALDLHPMSRAMGFGTRYLQEHHTAWVKKHGGWVSTAKPEQGRLSGECKGNSSLKWMIFLNERKYRKMNRGKHCIVFYIL